jgi:dolichol kinase
MATARLYHRCDRRSDFILTSKLRSVVHLSAILIPFLVEATSKPAVVVALVVTTAAYILSEVLRLRAKSVPLITRFTLAMSREDESPRLVVGPIYLAVGVLLSLLVFPNNIAYASITIVAVGDPVASYVGRKLGRTHVGKKTLEGFTAGLIVSSAAAALWVPPHLALAGSATGMLLELLEVIDDNLAIPIGAGSAMLVTTIL